MQTASLLIMALGLATMIPFIVAPPEKTEIEGEETDIEGVATDIGVMDTGFGGVETEIGGNKMKILAEKTQFESQDMKMKGEEEFKGNETEYKSIEAPAENETETADDSSSVYFMKKNFGNEHGHGQKEMQQVSDNMTTRQQFVTSPRESVTWRTEQLLREAHGLLKHIKSNKKNFGLEAFAYFLEQMLIKIHPEITLKKKNTAIEQFLQKFGAKAIKESFNEHTLPFAALNRKRKENFVQSLTVLPPADFGSGTGIPTKSESMQSDEKTSTSRPETTTVLQNSPLITSLSNRNIQLSVPTPHSPQTDSQEVKELHMLKEIHGPQDSYDDAYVPQDPSNSIKTSEISNSQESNVVTKSSEVKENHRQSLSVLPQSSENDQYLPNLATPESTVPESSRLHAVKLTSIMEEKRPAQAKAFFSLDNHISSLKGHKPSQHELVNNHLEESNNIGELQRELIEVALLQALEKAPKNSSVNESDISLSSSANKRTIVFQGNIDKKPTLTDTLPKSSLPQLTEDGPSPISVTALYHAVPEASQQVFQVASEAQTSVPKFKQDIPIQVNQEVTTTAILRAQTSNENRGYDEDDELVRELEELPRLVALERDQAQSMKTSSVSPIDTFTPESTEINSFVTHYKNDKEVEKRKIEINLAQEIRELRQLGATDEEIAEALGIDQRHLPGFQHLEKIGQEAVIHDRLNSNSGETMTQKIIPNNLKPFAHPYTQQPFANATFGGMHANLPRLNIVANQYQGGHRLRPYYPRMHVAPRNIQNMLHKLQRENYLLKAHLITYTQPNGKVNKMRGITYPGPNTMNSFLPHDIRYPTEFSLNPNIQTQRSIPVGHPYPLTMNSDLNNFTLKGNVDKESPPIPKDLPQTTVSEFTDEMKRELRDGKVILLSDSVVHSNFDNEGEKDRSGKERDSSAAVEDQVPDKN